MQVGGEIVRKGWGRKHLTSRELDRFIRAQSRRIRYSSNDSCLSNDWKTYTERGKDSESRQIVRANKRQRNPLAGPGVPEVRGRNSMRDSQTSKDTNIHRQKPCMGNCGQGHKAHEARTVPSWTYLHERTHPPTSPLLLPQTH